VGALPKDVRVAQAAAILEKYAADPITVDATISGLAGLESQVLDLVLQEDPPKPSRVPASIRTVTHPPDDHVAMLAAAIARGRNVESVSRLVAIASESNRAAWQRMAVLGGLSGGLDGGGGGRGGGGGGGGRGGRGFAGAAPVALTEEPVALTSLKDPRNGLTPFAQQALARLTWPGKPAPVVEAAPPLTGEQQKRFAQGQEVYSNLCVACHQPDGRGREKIAPTLVGSRYVVGDSGVSTRIVLSGKEGPTGLMPPLGASLSDDQIAAVLTYIRREWGHTASAVAPSDVKEVRGMTSSRTRPWTEDEIAKLAAGRGGRGGRGGQ